MPPEACFSLAVWQHKVRREEEEVLGRKRPRSDLGPALTVSLAWGRGTLHSTFVSLLWPRQGQVRFPESLGRRPRVAWCGVTGLSTLPASPGNSLTSCLNLCFPARPFALAQVPVTQPWAGLWHSFGSHRAQQQILSAAQGSHPLWSPPLVSQNGTSTCCL